MAIRGGNAVFVQLQGKVIGPVPVKDLSRLRGFNVNTFVSFPGSEKWAPAFRVLNLNSYEPPMAITQDTDLASSFQPDSWAVSALSMASRKSEMRIIQGHIGPDPLFGGRWTDRWFRRVATLNLLLVLGAWAAWSYPPMRACLRHELRAQLGETPKPAPLVIAHHARPGAVRARHTIKLARLY